MTFQRAYDDASLAAAVASSHSWRGVLRQLGLNEKSTGALRTARRFADELGFDYSHFTGQRRWTDAALRDAVAHSHSWTEVIFTLRIKGGSSHAAVRGHARRLGLDTSHFRKSPPRPCFEWDLVPDTQHLSRAGALLAAGWFALSGCDVSWPLEPCRYDLVVSVEGRLQRIQVTTTNYRLRGAWMVRLSPGDKSQVYDPDDIDSR
jgi:hypothetical protein